MFAASKTDSVSGSAPDGQFNYVTMLLHGDGTNGAQNNTFLDSSTNNFSITRNGNTTQGSFSPYGSNWSNYFPSSSYLQVANNTALQMSTGDFTIEFWLNFSSLSNYQTIFTKGYNNAGGLLVQTNTGTGTLLIYAAGSVVITASSASTLGTWNHYALVRNSGTLTLYLNGTSVGSVSNSTNFNNTESFNVGGSVSGYYTNGYISNFRVVKGTAVYTGSFTPSTTPLTAITNTQLLVCQSNRFVDNSANAFSSTITGTPSVQRFNPFGTSTAYSTSVIGGSGYFDGTTDYLTTPMSTPLTLGAGDFTIECWLYGTFVGDQRPLSCLEATLNYFIYAIYLSGTELRFYAGDGTSYAIQMTAAGAMKPSAWNHVAVVRSGSTATMYVNGVSVATDASASVTLPAAGTALWFGGEAYGGGFNFFNGYMTDARIVKGTAVYTAAFTPPTAPLTAITNTSILLNYTNGAIFDNAMMNDLETVGNAQISTSVKKYGTGSLAFDGTGDYLKHWKATNITLDTGAFTFEFWFQTSSSTQYATFFSNESGGGGFTILINSSAGNGVIQIYNGGSGLIHASSAGGYKNGVWHHLALSRDSSGSRFFINGTQQGATNSGQASAVFDGGDWIIGNNLSFSGRDYNGYIDDFRITKGYARYTANFTAPTAAFSDTGPY